MHRNVTVLSGIHYIYTLQKEHQPFLEWLHQVEANHPCDQIDAPEQLYYP